MRVLPLLIVLLTAIACTSGRADLEVFHRDLSVEGVYPERVVVGQALQMAFALRNHGTTDVAGCLGGAEGARVIDRAGHSATNVPDVRHLFCLRPFVLKPGQELSLSTEIAVPATLKPGVGELQLGAYVLSVHNCYEGIGCSHTWLEAPWREVALLGPERGAGEHLRLRLAPGQDRRPVRLQPSFRTPVA